MKDQLLLLFIGMAIASVLYGLLYWVRKLRDYLKELLSGLKGLAGLTKPIRQLVATSGQVVLELQMLRTILAANTVAPAGEQQGAETAGEARPRGQHAAFPGALMELYRDAPDATPEDTVVDETDDADMAERETLDRIRDRGLEVDE